MTQSMLRRVNIAVAVCGSAGLFGASGLVCSAQLVISAQAGLVSYTEGRVLLNDHAVRPVPGRFAQMRTDDVLRSTSGRGEILLNPGAFLRIRDRSAVRLLSNSLTEPRFEVLSGAVIVEVGDIMKATSVTAVWGGVSVSATKRGVFRLDTNPATLRVFEGEAWVASEGRSIKIGKGQRLPLGGTWTSAKFDKQQVDSFDRWSERRAGLLARVNARGRMSGRGLMRRGIFSGLYTAASPTSGTGSRRASGEGNPSAAEGTE